MLALFCLVFFTPIDRVDVHDVSRAETLSLHKADTVEHPVRLWIRIRGDIDGTAKIELASSFEETLSGRVDIERSLDWYVDAAEIIYTPELVDGGKLKVRYSFSGL